MLGVWLRSVPHDFFLPPHVAGLAPVDARLGDSEVRTVKTIQHDLPDQDARSLRPVYLRFGEVDGSIERFDLRLDALDVVLIAVHDPLEGVMPCGEQIGRA